ncbi:hypothetical protein BDR04DRAFT_1095600, partial [Suillus decipiens]
MPTEKNPGGLSPAKILTDNFEELKRVGNKSRRKFWNSSGQRIEGRDNSLTISQTTKSARMLHHLSAI